MAPGGARRVGAWIMLVCAVVVAAGVAAVFSSVEGFEDQASDLDTSEERANASLMLGWVGLTAIVFGLGLLLLAGLVFLVSTFRARRRAVERNGAHSVIAIVALVGAFFALFTLIVYGNEAVAGAFSGNGSVRVGDVTVQTFSGDLTAASVGGQTTEEDVHVVALPAATGAFRVRLASGGQGVNAAAIAILEAPEGSGWREIARTQAGSTDSTVDVASATYAGDLRVRVRLPDGAAAGVQYLLAVSFTPAQT